MRPMEHQFNCLWKIIWFLVLGLDSLTRCATYQYSQRIQVGIQIHLKLGSWVTCSWINMQSSMTQTRLKKVDQLIQKHPLVLVFTKNHPQRKEEQAAQYLLHYSACYSQPQRPSYFASIRKRDQVPASMAVHYQLSSLISTLRIGKKLLSYMKTLTSPGTLKPMVKEKVLIDELALSLVI